MMVVLFIDFSFIKCEPVPIVMLCDITHHLHSLTLHLSKVQQRMPLCAVNVLSNMLASSCQISLGKFMSAKVTFVSASNLICPNFGFYSETNR